MTKTTTELDPITFEVLRHKLDEIVAEAFYSIGRVSGSPIVVEAGDHQEALLTPSGEMAAFGAGVLHWGRAIGAGVKHLVSEYAENPGFAEDDQFLLNDPYIASVHAPDVQVLAPIFWEGELIAWSGSASHHTDIGGETPGSLCVGATEIFHEGVQIPGLKIVEGGIVRRDVEATFARMIRTPELGLLDLRAKIAANNVAKVRLHEMLERYGAETVKALMSQLISYSEGRLRARLREFPAGTWRSTNYVEGIADPYLKVSVAVTNDRNSLKMDFTGTSPQTRTSENMGPIATTSSAVVPMLAMLCHDLPWNEGLFKPLEFLLPEASVVNPVRPAAVSANVPTGANVAVIASVQNAIAKMLLASDEFRNDAAASVSVGRNDYIFGGRHRDGSYITVPHFDGLAGGVGGLPDRDGEDAAQNPWCLKTSIGNVETTELMSPLLYLWRKQVPDSGGVGRHRGGIGLSNAIVPWGTDELLLVRLGCGADARSGLGLAGGYPAPHAPLTVVRDVDIATAFREGHQPVCAEELEGRVEETAPKSANLIDASDVVYSHVNSGGGGFGDPLEREPRAVALDVQLGLVSRVAAADFYGVVLDQSGPTVDEQATDNRRKEIRTARLERLKKEGEGAKVA